MQFMKKEDIEEESELEEEIEEEEEEVQEDKLQEFLQQSTQSVTPTLQEVQSSQEQLETNVIQTPAPSLEGEEERPNMNYDLMAQEQERSYEIDSMRPSQLSSSEAGEAPRQEFLDPMQGRNLGVRDDMRPRQIEAGVQSTKKRLPFEKEDEKKYQVDMSKKSY